MPEISAARQLIEAYGDGGFRVAGQRYRGSILVFLDRTLSWPVDEAAAITIASLDPVTAAAPPPDILLVGCGPEFQAPPADLRAGLRDLGVSLEWMDTGAACRTFNVLLDEDRPAAAALIAIP